MINKAIFKQCVRSNGPIWLIFTLVTCLVLGLVIWSYDADTFSSVANAAEGTQFEEVASSVTTFLGTLESFYKTVATLLGMVYVIIAANNLVASEVDSGSMAYTLSTPIERSTVVITKMAYMVGSVVLMCLIVSVSGLACSELMQGCVTDSAVTEDVKAAAEALDRSESYVREHLYVIKDDSRALKAGADERDMDEDSYSLYLDKAMLRQSYKKAAKELTDERKDLYEDDDDMEDEDIEITWEELEEDPSLMLGSLDSLKKGAVCMNMSATEYRDYIELMTAPVEEAEGGLSDKEQETLFYTAVLAAATELGMDTATLTDNLLLMKDSRAMAAEMQATGLTEDMLVAMINETVAATALDEDDSIDFDLETYIWLNVGCCLVILAFSAIGFFSSCYFNLSKYAMALGGGLPFAFYVISIVQKMGENLEDLKYITITTLYDTEEILKLGDFEPGLAALAGIAVILYAAGCVIFCKKDLPL